MILFLVQGVLAFVKWLQLIFVLKLFFFYILENHHNGNDGLKYNLQAVSVYDIIDTGIQKYKNTTQHGFNYAFIYIIMYCHERLTNVHSLSSSS